MRTTMKSIRNGFKNDSDIKSFLYLDFSNCKISSRNNVPQINRDALFDKCKIISFSKAERFKD